MDIEREFHTAYFRVALRRYFRRFPIHSPHFASAFFSLSSILFLVFLSIHPEVLVTTHRARVHENVDRPAERVFSCKTSVRGKGLSFSFFSNPAQTLGNLSVVTFYVCIRSVLRYRTL